METEEEENSRTVRYDQSNPFDPEVRRQRREEEAIRRWRIAERLAEERRQRFAEMERQRQIAIEKQRERDLYVERMVTYQAKNPRNWMQKAGDKWDKWHIKMKENYVDEDLISPWVKKTMIAGWKLAQRIPPETLADDVMIKLANDRILLRAILDQRENIEKKLLKWSERSDSEYFGGPVEFQFGNSIITGRLF
jgi:hypothetical protein